MAASSEKISVAHRLTPLWVISLFVSFSEVAFSIAATQTTGTIQVILMIFVVLFPVAVAVGFFVILWKKSYVFYPPSEYGRDVSVEQYVKAMNGMDGPIVKETKDARDEGAEIFGNPDRLTLLFKARGSTWTRSTKAMEVSGGCVVQFSTKSLMTDGSWNLAEAATYVPGVTIQKEPEGEGRFLAPFNNDAQ